MNMLTCAYKGEKCPPGTPGGTQFIAPAATAVNGTIANNTAGVA